MVSILLNLIRIFGSQDRALDDELRWLELPHDLHDPNGMNKAFLYETLGRWDDALKTYRALVRNARPGYPQLLEHAKSRIRDIER
jgi:hypothetical protein